MWGPFFVWALGLCMTLLLCGVIVSVYGGLCFVCGPCFSNTEPGQPAMHNRSIATIGIVAAMQ